MKLLNKTALVALLGLLFVGVAPSAQAQISVGVNIGIPSWGPQVGPNMQYYYIPELDAYYDLYNQSYLFFDGYNWVSSYSLPPSYQGFDPYQFHPIPLAYVGPQPWLYVQRYPQRFAPYRRYYQQPRVVVVQPYRGGYGTYGRGYNGYGGNYNPGYRQQAQVYNNPGRGYDRDNGRGRDDRRGNYRPTPSQGQLPGRGNNGGGNRSGGYQDRSNSEGRQDGGNGGRQESNNSGRQNGNGGNFGSRGRVR